MNVRCPNSSFELALPWRWLISMLGNPSFAAERKIEIPLDPMGGLPVAEVVSALAQASGVQVERPAVALTLPTRGLAGSLCKTLLGECLGPDVRLSFRPQIVVLSVDEEDLAADRRPSWKRRLDDLAARSVQASQSTAVFGMRACKSYRSNDPGPADCLSGARHQLVVRRIRSRDPHARTGRLRHRCFRLSLQPEA